MGNVSAEHHPIDAYLTELKAASKDFQDCSHVEIPQLHWFIISNMRSDDLTGMATHKPSERGIP